MILYRAILSPGGLVTTCLALSVYALKCDTRRLRLVLLRHQICRFTRPLATTLVADPTYIKFQVSATLPHLVQRDERTRVPVRYDYQEQQSLEAAYVGLF